ncbi:LysR family transcriptional regulator [Acinetobacter sp. TGL-Y2]|uniref:LysR family transcriptional regulator n=1 Tax=Acinetobacter sp. TGL-Y2 TaxID=1407071 RepID=UPI0007A67266|nr:LysR family transcriptional regulator [Acinetobacter sp. TGL-Y2]AMW79429.1 LysR family transcriptional regulator [Acinetobacter sp. TGL-Y2]
MKNLKRMAIFTKVIEHGSMSAAARLLEMSPSAISQQIRYLEAENNVTLLHRSTRKLSLTETGKQYYYYCKQLCEVAEKAQALLDSEVKEPFGELRISAPVGLASYFISSFRDWSNHLPNLTISLYVQDQHIDLVENRIDLAIRVGEMPDSSYVASKISEMHMKLYASPSWIKNNQTIKHPNDLMNVNWLHLQSTNIKTPIQKFFLHSDTYKNHSLKIIPKYIVNNINILREMCEQGFGICTLSTFEAEESVYNGKIVPILPDWNIGKMNIWAVTPQRNFLSAKVRQAIELIQKKLN